ncbi:uncharacterized protein RSE6_02983 [Rhynchosporium secalis]|uniref:DUF7923 domain-containing protein n=1 Tax=Rhynchosporium secalis TaxID=38038 RepID=A0A1E1M1P9_RHYSE|nr:uncharacterized protein RSE6_02983 [Rhynchosporium secalis]
MAFIVHESSVDVGQDLRRRFAEIEQLDVLKRYVEQYRERLRAQVEQLKALNHELKEQLAKSDSQLAESNKKRKRETQDLDSEKETRRQCQERAEISSARVAAVDQGKFMLVLIDADAQTNLFRDEYLTRGMDGGHAAADVLKEKVQEHLVNGLGASVEKTKALPIMIKAFANLEGLSNYCVKSQRLRSQDALSKFWAGFSRSSALVDFIDVGRGKEEADSKLREVLAFYINNPLCTHIMLMCCHDAGYIPVLRPYSVKSMLSQKITLISTGGILPSIAALNFRSTKIFEPLFSGIGSPKSANQATLQLSKRVHEQHKPTPIVTSQAKECSQVSPTGSTGSGQASSTGANAKSVYQIGRPIGHENFVANAHRLGPVLRTKKQWRKADR